MALPDIVERGLGIVDECERRGVVVRLLGGVAVYLLVSDIYSNVPFLSRTPKDIDLAAHGKDSGALTKTLTELGFEPDKMFNALHGYERLRFTDKLTGARVDVFLDVFRESHVISLKDRLELFKPTIPPSDLLLTKLQIWRISERDVKDIVAMLIKFKLSDRDSLNEIDAGRIVGLTSGDWGLYKTTMINLSRVIEYVNSVPELSGIKAEVARKVSELSQAIEKAPKSIKWRLRSIIGERVRWYEEPEEV